MSNKVILAAAVLGTFFVSAPARGQSSVGVVRVFTEPAGIYFQVDGQTFLGSADFPWPASSKHVVTSYDQSQTQPGAKFVYKGWSTNLSATISNAQPITAGPGLQWIKLTFDTTYALSIMLVDCPEAGQPCPSAGRVEVVGNGTFDRKTQLYISKDAVVEARAFPNAGYIFTGWAQVNGKTGRPTSFNIKFTMDEPSVLQPTFSPANSVTGLVNIQTEPPQLQILLDRSPYTAPVSLEWGWGTVHSVGVNPVQLDHGTVYVFDSWSDGGAINHEITVPSQAGPLRLTARFVPGTYVSFQTSPAGLPLSIDGRQNWPQYGFTWAPGTVHRVSAPLTQTDSQGRRYRFVSWSNGQPAAFDYTVTAGGGDFTAVYQALGQATITTVPSGMSLLVDDATCTTPCSIEKDAGKSVKIVAPATRDINEGSRLVFQGWGDTADTTRVVALTADPKTYRATYLSQHRLWVSATPPEGASFTLEPSSTDGFYNEGEVVGIGVKLGLGFRIMAWSGDVPATGTNAAVRLDNPKSAVVLLDRVPGIAPLGIRSAAGGASADSVAAGSLISIFGANLAPNLQVGPLNPLAQTLAGVTVRVDSSFLPLIFVSPEQINAQLPALLSEGNHRIYVRWEGKPETSAQITVSRNAPGLFGSGPADRQIGSFVRPNGEAVTEANPARADELVSILATGLGPYVQAPPDGFAVDETAGYTIADTVVVLAGDAVVDVIFAGRSSAATGVDAVRFRVPANLPDGDVLPVKVRVNERESNIVLLPISH